MLTSKSNNREFQRFFDQYSPELVHRLKNLINKKYGHSLVKTMQRGGEFPPIFGSLKIGDITIYGYPTGIKHTRKGFEFDTVPMFLIMKDLRKQTRIMVTSTSPTIIYSTHAISRYKERTGLDEGTDFINVCKDMLLTGCTSTCGILNSTEIYGSYLNSRTMQIVCAKGVFLGYISAETDIAYGETFLSTNVLKKDQQHLNVDRNPLFQRWKEINGLYFKGKATSEELEESKKGINGINNLSPIAIRDGQILSLSEEEIIEQKDKMDQLLEAQPDYFESQATINKLRPVKRLQKKGYM